MTPFHKGLIQEKEELDDRTAKLEDYLNTIHFKLLKDPGQDLVKTQIHTMKTYSQCLVERIVNLQN